MTPTEAEITDMEKFFAGVTLPLTFKPNPATTITDLKGFIQNVLRTIRMRDVADLVVRLRWDDLCQIRSIMEKEQFTVK